MTVEEAIDVLKKDIKCYTDNPCSEPCEPGGCPYFIDDNDIVEAEQIAIEALEKQIPKKPIGDLNSVPHYRCPYCNRAVKLYENDRGFDFCPDCGQRLDWSRDE